MMTVEVTALTSGNMVLTAVAFVERLMFKVLTMVVFQGMTLSMTWTSPTSRPSANVVVLWDRLGTTF
jgi:hypothetical protein